MKKIPALLLASVMLMGNTLAVNASEINNEYMQSTVVEDESACLVSEIDESENDTVTAEVEETVEVEEAVEVEEPVVIEEPTEIVETAETVETDEVVLPPSNLALSNYSFDSVRVSFDVSENADSYYIYRKEENGNYVRIAVVQKDKNKTLEYIDSGLECGKNYYYHIKGAAQTASGIKYSSYTKASSIQCKSEPVEITVSTIAGINPYLEWKPVSGTASNGLADGYCVYRSSDIDGKYTKIGTVSGIEEYSFADKKASVGQTYFYKIISYCIVNDVKENGRFSEVVSIKVVPQVPDSLKAMCAAYSSNKLAWEPVADVDGYRIYRSDDGGKTFNFIYSLKSDAVSFTDKGLTCGKEYKYRIRSFKVVDSVKILSPFSPIVSAAPSPSVPEDLSAEPKQANKAQLSWSSADGAESYNIYRAGADVKYELIANVCDTSYLDEGLTNGNLYYYRVSAVAGTAESKKCHSTSIIAAKLTIKETSIVVNAGEKYTINADIAPAADAEWSSSDSKIAVVSSDGTVTGKSAGTVKITVQANKITRTVKVTVKSVLTYGIDISKWQGTDINFSKVKAAGKEFVMIRLYNGATGEVDPCFESNYLKAAKAGLKIGAYIYSYATTVDAAKAEVNKAVKLLDGKKLDYPLCLDYEAPTILNKTTKTQRTDIILYYKKRVEKAGYRFMLYASESWLTYEIDNKSLSGVDIWVARYCSYSLGHRYTGGGNVAVWQYTDQGKVNGINGYVDLDVCYIKMD